MYTFGPPILYSENTLRRVVPGQHPTKNKFKDVCTRRYGAVRSFFGGFSSTAGYVPGNEAQLRPEGRVSGVALDRLIISDERYPFLSG